MQLHESANSDPRPNNLFPTSTSYKQIIYHIYIFFNFLFTHYHTKKLNKRQLDLAVNTPAVFEGRALSAGDTEDQRISKSLSGKEVQEESRKSPSIFDIKESRFIHGIEVPNKPVEPDDCCMSGCINCVWELYNDDIKIWQAQRRLAVKKLEEEGGHWPENFDPPSYLKFDNLPKSLQQDGTTKQQPKEEESNVPVAMSVFAEMERKMRQKQST